MHRGRALPSGSEVETVELRDGQSDPGFVFDQLFQPLLLCQAYRDKERAAPDANNSSLTTAQTILAEGETECLDTGVQKLDLEFVLGEGALGERGLIEGPERLHRVRCVLVERFQTLHILHVEHRASPRN